MERIPAWHAAEATRLVKTPKLHAVDTGLMCAVRGINRRRLLGNPADLGSLLETFVYSELRKQSLWVDEPLAFHHYRGKDKVEVDIVMESASGGCYGFEVRAAASLRARDFTGLRRFRRVAGRRFRMGVLLYDGDHTTATFPLHGGRSVDASGLPGEQVPSRALLDDEDPHDHDERQPTHDPERRQHPPPGPVDVTGQLQPDEQQPEERGEARPSVSRLRI